MTENNIRKWGDKMGKKKVSVDEIGRRDEVKIGGEGKFEKI